MKSSSSKKEKSEELLLAASKKKNKVFRTEKPGKGIDTMFKTTINNQYKLSGYADNKAHILLSVNTIIISVSLSILFPKLGRPANAHLIIPALILITFSVTSIIFAILTTRPSITKAGFSRTEVEKKKLNLLFFGNFYKTSFEDYNWAVHQMLNDSEYLYDSMVKDLYYHGLVLKRKYSLLRVTYNIFMFGIIVSVFAFLITLKFW
ncbi:hypothetical protein BC749_10988 [Flavobacterium araucananum]|uniref:Pycsar effector protein domain-containing protein n=2 Tax=Flavobacterium araucananum TaxID=946678 RepID=A0A227P6R6_9FLAO|nr:hypothetical protein B0A64_13780 [Flavobacterium araucananum]PWJ96811.1 hypothetical protein BC749_10988 [Flavobacterium araucananum]